MRLYISQFNSALTNRHKVSCLFDAHLRNAPLLVLMQAPPLRVREERATRLPPRARLLPWPTRTRLFPRPTRDGEEDVAAAKTKITRSSHRRA